MSNFVCELSDVLRARERKVQQLVLANSCTAALVHAASHQWIGVYMLRNMLCKLMQKYQTCVVTTDDMLYAIIEFFIGC